MKIVNVLIWIPLFMLLLPQKSLGQAQAGWESLFNGSDPGKHWVSVAGGTLSIAAWKVDQGTLKA